MIVLDNKRININLEEDCPVCSCTDLTGLIPSGKCKAEELEIYDEMYGFLPKVITKKEEDKDCNRDN